MKLNLLLLVFILLPSSIFAQYYDWNTQCEEAYQKIFEFRFDEAQQILNAENKENLIADFLESYIYFFKILVDEQHIDLDAYNSFQSDLINRISKTGNNEPYKKYCLAELQLFSAIGHFTFDEYWNGFWALKKAFKNYEINDKNFPNFLANKKGLGLLHMMVGTLPDKYKWGARIVGFSGTVEQGADEIFEFVNAKNYYHPTKDEAKLLFAAYKLFVEQDESMAHQMVDMLDPNKSVINRFIVANLSYRMGDNDKAIDLLENRPTGSNYYPVPAFDLLVGTYKLNRLDDNADIYIKRFLQLTKSKTYLKEAYQRLAWHELIINNNSSGYTMNMAKILEVGNVHEDEDKMALLEAEKNTIPNVNLLKAKLLYNGGYFKNSLDQLANIDENVLTDEGEFLEYNYRYGRNFQQLGDNESAINYLKFVIDRQANDALYYFAPKACVEIASIYANQKQTEKAKTYYNKTFLFTSDYLYKAAIENQAKQGLKKL